MGAKTLSTLDLRPTFRPHASLLALPGAGKTILARRLTAILPAMSLAAALETARMHRVALLTAARTAMITMRPSAPRSIRSPMYA
jgi:predicted ATPase with chaperone activity